MEFEVVETPLSDDSIAHNVVGTDGEYRITFGATGKQTAHELAALLNDDVYHAWVSIERVA